MTARVLVTGATGFIGCQVAARLSARDCRVYGLARRSPGELSRHVAEKLAGVELFQGDVCHAERLEPLLAQLKPDVCIHLAWTAQPGEYLTSPRNVELLAGTLSLSRLLIEGGCRRIVGIGSCFEYDTTIGRLSEESPTRPRSLYAACKLALNLTLEQLCRLHQVSFAWARIFYQYGPLEPERRVVPDVIRSLLRGQPAKATTGEQVRDFLHVADVGEAIAAIAMSEVQGVVNVGSGEPVTVRELVTTIGALCGRPELIELGAIPQRPGDPAHICAAVDKLKNETGFRRRYDLESGLRDTIEWQRRMLMEAAS